MSGLYETRAFGSGEESVADGSKSGEEGGVTNCKLYRIVPARAVAGVVAFCFADSSQSAGTDGGVAGAGGATMDGGVAGAGGACIIDYIFFYEFYFLRIIFDHAASQIRSPRKIKIVELSVVV